MNALATPWETIAAALAAAVNRPRQLPVTPEQVALFHQLHLALERGDTGIVVDEATRKWLLDQPWAGNGTPPTPVVVTGPFVQWYRYWRAEQAIAATLTARLAAASPALTIPEPVRTAATAWGLHDAQIAALARMVAQPVTLLTGGPGTGKTTTLVWFLAALAMSSEQLPTVALAAPTGKAAQRMSEAIAQVLKNLPLAPAIHTALAQLSAQTLHRLLGIGRFAQPRHTAENPLPHSWVIIDEGSMVDLLLLEKVVAALAPHARLIVIGDPNQLAPVEAGSVLGDLVTRFPACHVPLKRSHRFGAGIGALAEAVLAGDAKAAWALVSAGSPTTDSELTLLPATREALLAAVDDGYATYLDHLSRQKGRMLSDDEAATLARALLGALTHFRVLTPLRHHPQQGTDALNDLVIDHWHRRGIPFIGDRLLLGHAVQITANDYTTNLYNGDLGVLLPAAHGLVAWFADPGSVSGMRPIPFTQLPPWENAWVSTVHKAQGSEFTAALLYLPHEADLAANRALLYTAITRAKRRFLLATEEDTFAKAVARPTQRLSGWQIAAER
jgi:exodeoxyribonuclease V alpha subunit